MPHPWILARKLKALIRSKGLSIAEAGRRAGLAQPTISVICNGRQPTPKTLATILEAIGATEQELLDAEPADE